MSTVSDSVKKLLAYIKQDALQDTLFFMLQSIINTHSGHCVGAEALVRGRVDGTTLFPDRFIPQLEENGDIRKVGLYVLQSALRFACEHRWYQNAEFKLSINFSPLEINDRETVKGIATIGGATAFRKKNIVIEITETDIPLTTEGRKNASWLQREGFTLAWDDIQYPEDLAKNNAHFTADVIKLDRSLLFPDALPRARQLIELCQAHGLPVIAEGVENAEQLHWLQEQNINFCQGYYFSPPISKQRFQESFIAPFLSNDIQFESLVEY